MRMNKHEWLNLIKVKAESQKVRSIVNVLSELNTSDQKITPSAWRTHLGWAMLGALGILLVLGVYNLSMENYALRQQLEKPAQRDVSLVIQASYKKYTPPKVDLYSPVPDLPIWYTQTKPLDTHPKFTSPEHI